MTNKERPRPNEDNDSTPDGGYGWVVTICVALINGHSWGISAVYSVFLVEFIKEQTFPGATHLEYACIGSLGVGCMFLISPLVTIAVREIGTRPIMLVGAVIQSLSLVFASLSTKIWHLFLSQGVMFGIGMGLLFLPSYGVISQWFAKRRALANGFAIAGAGMGGLVYSLATGAMLQSLGLQWSYRILSIVSGVVNISSSVLIKTRYATIGAQPLALDLSLLKRTEYLLIVGFSFASMLGYFILIFTLANYATFIGLSSSQGSVIPALMMFAQAVGRPVIGWAGDSYGRINITFIMTLLTGFLSLAVWIKATTYPLLLFFALIVGLCMGVFWVTIAPVIAGVLGLENLPSGLSLLWLTLVLPCTFSEPIALEIVTTTGDYLGAQLFTGIIFIVAALCMLCLRGWEIGRVNNISQSEGMRQEEDNTEARKHKPFTNFICNCFLLRRI